MKQVSAIVQARMGSTRLPGKIMKEIIGKPMIDYVIERISKSSLISEIIIATSEREDNYDFIKYLDSKEIKYYVGNEEDVLSRYYYTAKQFNTENIVRITADCPLIDPLIIDNTVKEYFDSSTEYTSNIYPRSFPKGLDTEVFSFKALERANYEATSKYDREHVTSYIRESGKFKISNYSNGKDYSKLRLTVDWMEDFILIERIFKSFSPNIFFNWLDIISKLDNNQDLIDINKHLS